MIWDENDDGNAHWQPALHVFTCIVRQLYDTPSIVLGSRCHLRHKHTGRRSRWQLVARHWHAKPAHRPQVSVSPTTLSSLCFSARDVNRRWQHRESRSPAFARYVLQGVRLQLEA